MPDETKGVDITLMGRHFRVSCAEGEEKQLLAAVDFLNRRMDEIQANGKVMSSERLAIMVALNIAHELLTMRAGKGLDLTDFRRRIREMEDKLDRNMVEQERLF
jgi:cell division protein ZapA